MLDCVPHIFLHRLQVLKPLPLLPLLPPKPVKSYVFVLFNVVINRRLPVTENSSEQKENSDKSLLKTNIIYK